MEDLLEEMEKMRKTKAEAAKETTKEKTQQSEEQIKELTELLQRTQANFENYRKQMEKRIEEIQNQANKNLIVQLLPILDDFELALKNTDNPPGFIKGIKLIYSQISTILESDGLKSIKTENQRFDPYMHEALLKMNSDQPENKVLEEFQKGYLLNDQVIRHAKVKISSGKNDKPALDEQTNKKIDKIN